MQNKHLYYLISFFGSFSFTIGIWTFFMTNYNNLSYSEAFFVTLFYGIVSLLFEIPSGSWCDRFGRKKMYILGSILNIFSLVLWININYFYLFVIASIIQGIGLSMLSGNLEALIHDELQENKNESDFKNIQANGYIFLFSARIIGSILGGYLYIKNPVLPYLLTIIFNIIVLIFVFFLKEPKQNLSKSANDYIHLKETIKYLKENINIYYFILILSVYSGIGNIYFFTYQIFFKEIGLSIQNISILFGITGLFASIGSYIIKKIQDKVTQKNLLLIMIYIGLLCSVLLYFSNIYLGFIVIALNSIMGGFIMPFGNNVLMKNSPSDKKSTILSVFSAFRIFSYSFLNIIIGFFLDYYSLKFIYIFSCILGIFLFIFTIFKYNNFNANIITKLGN